MVGWHHRLDGQEFEQALRVGDGQGAWSAAIHGITKSQTRLNDSTELNRWLIHVGVWQKPTLWPPDVKNQFI